MKRNVKSWSYYPLKLEQIESLGKNLDQDHKKFVNDKSESDLLAVAFGYVLGYPMFRQLIGNDLNDDGAHTRWHVLESLNHVHMLAINLMITEAERYGLDGSPLLEHGRICRRLFEDGGAKYMVGEFDYWPECLGQSIETLPDCDKRIIREGEAVFRRLDARAGIPLDDPVQRTWNTGAFVLPAAHISSPPLGNAIPDRVEESEGKRLFFALLGIKPDRTRWNKERKEAIPSIEGCLTLRMLFKRVREILCKRRDSGQRIVGGVSCERCSRRVPRLFPGTKECPDCYMSRIESEYEKKHVPHCGTSQPT